MNFYTDGGLNIMKPISPLLIEVAFKQYQEHDGDPHQGYGGGAHRGGGFASVPRVHSRVLMEDGAFHSLSTKSAARCSSSRGLSISTKSAAGVLLFGRFQCDKTKQTD
jgi:hypothetical protein